MQSLTNTQPTFIISTEGTLINEYGIVHTDFKNWLTKWASKRTVYLTSNNSFNNAMKELGSYLCLAVTEVHNNCGNTVWAQGRSISKSKLVIPAKVRAWLEFELGKSSFHIRVGDRTEDRPGMAYGTTVGLGASQKEKEQYALWDAEHKERESVVNLFNSVYTDYEAYLDGDIGISITAAGLNKGQLVNKLTTNIADKFIVFIGHQIDDLSNDSTIVKNLRQNDVWHSTANWQETWKLLKTNYDQPIKK
jgi:Eukaryotic phosphomannomutase